MPAVSYEIKCSGTGDADDGACIAPLAEVAIAAQDRRCGLLSFLDQVVDVLIV
jgi:hypothetical protein